MNTHSTNAELMHPVGDADAWSESYYFNFVDGNTGVGMFTRMGFRPGDSWADALHAIYLPGVALHSLMGAGKLDQTSPSMTEI